MCLRCIKNSMLTVLLLYHVLVGCAASELSVFTCHGCWVLFVHSPIVSWITLTFTCHGWGALTYHGLRWHLPVLTYAGIHRAFTDHGNHWHSPVMADCVLLHLHLWCAARDEDIVSKSQNITVQLQNTLPWFAFFLSLFFPSCAYSSSF